MAVNQTAIFMKNVILTHKELQWKLFEAFTQGLLSSVNFGSEDLYLSIDITDRDYIWQVTKEKGGVRQIIYWCYICKGDSEMNDVRLGVTIGYLREKADEFLKGFKEFYYGAPKTEPVSPEGKAISSESKVLNADLSGSGKI